MLLEDSKWKNYCKEIDNALEKADNTIDLIEDTNGEYYFSEQVWKKRISNIVKRLKNVRAWITEHHKVRKSDLQAIKDFLEELYDQSTYDEALANEEKEERHSLHLSRADQRQLHRSRATDRKAEGFGLLQSRKHLPYRQRNNKS